MGNSTSKSKTSNNKPTTVIQSDVSYQPVSTHDPVDNHESKDDTTEYKEVELYEQQSNSHVNLTHQLPCELESFLAYKHVNVLDSNNHLIGNAILWLQIPYRNNSIYFSETRKPVPWSSIVTDGLQPKSKYCARICQVLGVQFVSKNLEASIHMMTEFFHQRIQLASTHDVKFLWHLESTHIENNSGQKGYGGCAQGLHFFKDAKSAIRYNDAFKSNVVITRVLRGPVLDEERFVVSTSHFKPPPKLRLGDEILKVANIQTWFSQSQHVQSGSMHEKIVKIMKTIQSVPVLVDVDKETSQPDSETSLNEEKQVSLCPHTNVTNVAELTNRLHNITKTDAEVLPIPQSSIVESDVHLKTD